MNDENGKAMKISEERREVASRLRNLAGHRSADEELTLEVIDDGR